MLVVLAVVVVVEEEGVAPLDRTEGRFAKTREIAHVGTALRACEKPATATPTPPRQAREDGEGERERTKEGVGERGSEEGREGERFDPPA